MANFVSLFDNTESISFINLLDESNGTIFMVAGPGPAGPPAPNPASENIFCGKAGVKAGLFTKINSSGTVLLAKKYALQAGNDTIYFTHVVRCPNGDYILYGPRVISQSRSINMVVRVNSSGTVLWSHTIGTDNTSSTVQLMRSGNKDYYFILSRSTNNLNKRDIELIMIDGKGEVQNYMVVGSSGNDDIATGMIPYGANGCLVYGNSSEQQGMGGFVIAFDETMHILWAKLVGTEKLEEIRNMVAVDEKTFYITGENNERRDSFLFKFDMMQDTHDVYFFNALDGDDVGGKRLAYDGQNCYLTGYNASKSFVLKFDPLFNLSWAKKIGFSDQHFLSGMLKNNSNPEELVICGYTNNGKAILIRSDKEFNTCLSELYSPPVTKTVFKSQAWNPPFVQINQKETVVQVATYNPVLNETRLCPSASKIVIEGNPMFQSPYVYLQAAGSDKADGTAKGIHLRWDLLKTLGDNHIPKGDYTLQPDYATTLPFNRSNDYVRVYRTKYPPAYVLKVKLKNNNLPTYEMQTGVTREWWYNGLLGDPTLPDNLSNVVVKFTDTAQYDTIRSQSATLNVEAILKAYTGLIEVSVLGRPMFAMEMDFDLVQSQPSQLANAFVRLESISLDTTDLPGSPYISCRKKLTWTQKNNGSRIVAENMSYVRFDRNNAYPSEIRIETYQDFFLGTNARNNNLGKWDFVGDFALTLDNNIAYTRLEKPSEYVIDKEWPKFNEYDTMSGAYTLKVDNYKDRWIPDVNPDYGLKSAVQNYLTLSTQDAKATASLPSTAIEDPEFEDLAMMDISYLDMLRMVSLDYHAARMLGLGHIDSVNQSPNDLFIYCMQYVTEDQLSNDQQAPYLTSHFYMSLPTGRKDYRLPPPPKLNPVEYGFSVDNGTPTPTPLTDEAGYTPFDDIRFINLNREVLQYEKPFGPFFFETVEFCFCNETQPVMYGVEYRKQGESNFRKPEISSDPNYIDYAGYPEVMPIPELDKNPVFTHQEREEGIHEYAMYSINWFSRISPLSNLVPTDYTQFNKRNTILPPFNLAVQLIQQENPRIFTTQFEQTMLGNLTTEDKTLARVNFDWNHNHNIAYQFADRVELFFRENEPNDVIGKITGVTNIAGNKVQVQVGSFDILSTNPVQTISPVILTAEIDKYIGSFFTTGQRSYVIDNIIQPNADGQNPVFVLNRIRETSSMDPLNNNQFITTENYISPDNGERFLVVENMSKAQNWDTSLSKRVYIEKFHTNNQLTIDSSSGNDGTYTLDKVNFNGSNTELFVREGLMQALTPGNLIYQKELRLSGINSGGNAFLVSGNFVSEISLSETIRIYGSNGNDNIYNVNSVSLSGSNTQITVNETIPVTTALTGYLSFEKEIAIASVSVANSSILVSGNLTSEIIAPYTEYKTENDLTLKPVTIGGIIKQATVSQFMEINSNNDPEHFGVYDLTFNGYNLPPHIDPEIDWYNGFVRIADTNPDINKRSMKTLQVLEIKRDDVTRVILTPLQLVVFDPEYIGDPVNNIFPIQTGNIAVNYHPSYKFYITADVGTIPDSTSPSTVPFKEGKLLPAVGDGSKTTFFGARAYDSVNDVYSYVVPPVLILAQEIQLPAAPAAPAGPLFATRPDFYRKSSYTFDLGLDTTGGRRPFAMAFYRADERKILDTLYNKDTVPLILEELEALKNSPYGDLSFSARWNSLLNVETENTGLGLEFKQFETYTDDEGTTHYYRFRLPDNPDYVIPNRDSSIIVKPFDPSTNNGNVRYLNESVAGRVLSIIVDEAIRGAFLPLTEQPLVYKFIRGGVQTSSNKPVLRNQNGDMILPVLPGSPNPEGYDPAPMATRLSKNGTSIYVPGDSAYENASNDFYIRFTDYTLDGASKSIYFYYAAEFSNRMEMAYGPIAGPINLINAIPAETPGIRKVLTQLQSPSEGKNTAVLFDVNPYIASEGIKSFKLYRATEHVNALSLRTMTPLGSISAEDLIQDNFQGLDFPLYGEPLYYRVVAEREIKNELNLDELIPSLPSNLVLASVVDVLNPPPPKLRSRNGSATTSQLNQVILSWEPTCYNGTYSLQKMNENGNWVEFYKTKVKDAAMQYPPLDEITQLPDFTNYNQTNVLQRQDANGNAIYHRYRVQVENSSGLFNLSEFEITLAKGAMDLQEIASVLSYMDGEGHEMDILSSADLITGESQPTTMTFTHLDEPLPAGHNSFASLDITVTDDLGNSKTLSITTAGGNVTFNATTAPGLDLTTPNRIYTVRTKLYTDFASTGATKVFTINYLAGPEYDLKQITNLVKLSDATHDVDPLISGNINNGVAFPTELKFTKLDTLADQLLAINQTFDQIDIQVTDNLGNTATKTIPTEGTDATFLSADGLALGAVNPNGRYEIKISLFTNEYPAGNEINYSISYTYSPCDDLIPVATLSSLTDGNSHTINPLSNQTVPFPHPDGTITITELISANLPAGHSFDHLDVILEDDLGGAILKTIEEAEGSVVFSHGDGDLILDDSNPNRTYFITLVLYTDLCSNGKSESFTITYGE